MIFSIILDIVLLINSLPVMTCCFGMLYLGWRNSTLLVIPAEVIKLINFIQCPLIRNICSFNSFCSCEGTESDSSQPSRHLPWWGTSCEKDLCTYDGIWRVVSFRVILPRGPWVCTYWSVIPNSHMDHVSPPCPTFLAVETKDQIEAQTTHTMYLL